MVIDNETLQPLHPLSKEGEKTYREFISDIADEYILRNDHPFLYLIYKLSQLFKIEDSVIERRYNQVLQEIKENRL